MSEYNFYAIHRWHELSVRNRTGCFISKKWTTTNYIHTVGLVTDYAILWVCSICGLIPCFFFLCNLLHTTWWYHEIYIYDIQFRSTDIFPLVYISDIMAVPPAYSDLGKAAKDVFSKGYGKNTHSALLQMMLLHHETTCIVQ